MLIRHVASSQLFFLILCLMIFTGVKLESRIYPDLGKWHLAPFYEKNILHPTSPLKRHIVLTSNSLLRGETFICILL